MTRRHALTSKVRALTVVLITTGALTACTPAEPTPSPQYRDDVAACDRIPDFGARATCALNAARAETRRDQP